MDADYPIIEEPATAEYVLAVLRDLHRQQCQYDPEAEADVSLTFDSTIDDWRAACDLEYSCKLGRSLNQYWGITCSDEEWHAVLEPATEQRLAGVCELIARQVRRPRIRPAKFFGRTCAPAGAFLTVRSILHQAGAPAEAITPSSPLAPYTRRYCELFLGRILRLAPGAMPPVKIRKPLYDASILGLLIGIVVLLCGAFGKAYGAAAIGSVVAFSCYVGIWIAARGLPSSVQFGQMKTFRDLAVVIAAGGPPETGGEGNDNRT
jgi:hypothetical protein